MQREKNSKKRRQQRLERLIALASVSVIMLLCIMRMQDTEVVEEDIADLYCINIETEVDMVPPDDELKSEVEKLVTAAVYLAEDGSDELSAEEAIEGYASLKGYSLSDYPETLIELYGKNADAREYVLDYPEKKDVSYDINLDEYKNCTDVPLLMQWDERWGYGTYSGEIFGRSACGPTCLSMAAIYLLGDTDMNPKWMADFATENGYSTNGSGTAWALFSTGAAQLGIQVSNISLNEDAMKQALDEGGLIACIVGPGDFTDGGHYILIKGYDEDGFIINDSNSYTNSAKRWSFETLYPQIRNLWGLSSSR